jgi:hypothetical protein
MLLFHVHDGLICEFCELPQLDNFVDNPRNPNRYVHRALFTDSKRLSHAHDMDWIVSFNIIIEEDSVVGDD